jgi:hypothetical protein
VVVVDAGSVGTTGVVAVVEVLPDGVVGDVGTGADDVVDLVGGVVTDGGGVVVSEPAGGGSANAGTATLPSSTRVAAPAATARASTRGPTRVTTVEPPERWR